MLFACDKRWGGAWEWDYCCIHYVNGNEITAVYTVWMGMRLLCVNGNKTTAVYTLCMGMRLLLYTLCTWDNHCCTHWVSSGTNLNVTGDGTSPVEVLSVSSRSTVEGDSASWAEMSALPLCPGFGDQDWVSGRSSMLAGEDFKPESSLLVNDWTTSVGSWPWNQKLYTATEE